MLRKKNFLTLLLTKESTEHVEDLNTSLELFIFLIRYSFLLTNTPAENIFSKRQIPSHGELFFKNSNGTRYLDPKYSRWISVDPALGEYMSGSDAGCGGIYNHVNMSLYHYAGNNPIKYLDPDGREEKCAYSQSLGNHDLLPTIDEVDTGCEPVDFTLAVLGSTYNLLAQGVNTLNNGIFSGFELLCKGIDWLDENWPNDYWTLSGNGIKADLEMFCFVGMSRPQLVSDIFSLTKSSGSYLNAKVGSLTNPNLKTILSLSKSIESKLGVSMEAQELTFKCLDISSKNTDGLLMVSQSLEKMVSTGSISRGTIAEMNKFSGFLLQNIEKQELVTSLKTLQDITGTLGGY